METGTRENVGTSLSTHEIRLSCLTRFLGRCRLAIEHPHTDYDVLGFDPNTSFFVDEETSARLANAIRLLRSWEQHFPYVSHPTIWTSVEDEVHHAMEVQDGVLLSLTGDLLAYDALKPTFSTIAKATSAGQEVQLEFTSIMNGLRSDDPTSFAMLFPTLEKIHQRMHWLCHLHMNAEVSKVIHLKNNASIAVKLIEKVRPSCV